MTGEMMIRVGIVTDGEPSLHTIEGGLTVVRNQLIGKDFHWQQTREAVLPGKIEILDGIASDGVRLINTLPLEKYLEIVVGSEMNPSAPSEFLKTHAILSRSWAIGKILRCHQEGSAGKTEKDNLHIGWDDTADHNGFHVCADDHCQRYQGITDISPQGQAAIRETAGIILTDSLGEPVDARFSKCCGGHTELFSTCWQDVTPPGLTARPDPWCDLSAMDSKQRGDLLSVILKDYDRGHDLDFHTWEESVDKRFIANRLRELFNIEIGERAEQLFPLATGPSGRHHLLRIIGDKAEATIGKELHIRRVLSKSHLKSSAFSVLDEGDIFHLKGRGWGHGVGLCQIGAARMALTHNHTEILRYYFPDAQLSPLPAPLTIQ